MTAYIYNSTKKVERIIHQVWFDLGNGNNVPAHLWSMQDSWKEFHPHWEYILWSKDKSNEFIARYYAWFLDTWNSYKEPIYQVDAIRYFILYHYGGLYVDLDAKCLRSFEDLRSNQITLIGTPNASILSNYFMMGQRGHLFFKHCIDHLIYMSHSILHLKNSFLGAMMIAGPGYLSYRYISYDDPAKDQTICLLDYCYFRGADKKSQLLLYEKYNDLAYGNHEFHCSWSGKTKAWNDVRRLLMVLLGLCILIFIVVKYSRRLK